GSAFFSSFAGAAGAAIAGSAWFPSAFTSPPQPQLEPQLEQPQLLSQPQLWQPQLWQPQPHDQPPQLPQLPCEKMRPKQPPKQPPCLPQLPPLKPQQLS